MFLGQEPLGFERGHAAHARRRHGLPVDVVGNVAGSADLKIGGQAFAIGAGFYHQFIAHLAPDGTPVWVRFIEHATFTEPSVLVDPSDRVFYADIPMGGNQLDAFELQGCQWVYCYFLAELDTDGKWAWVSQVPHAPTISGDAGLLSLHTRPGGLLVRAFTRGAMQWTDQIRTETPRERSGIARTTAIDVDYDDRGNIVSATLGGPSPGF